MVNIVAADDMGPGIASSPATELKNVTCKMAAIMSQPKCGNRDTCFSAHIPSNLQ